MSTRGRQGKRALLGAAIIVMLVALSGSIFMLDDIIAAFRSSYEVVAVLPEAPRVSAGARVWVSGNDVGEVRTVWLLPTPAGAGRVALALRLPGRVREQVRRDSQVRLTSLNVMGAPVVDISAGSAGTPALDAGDTLVAVRSPGRAELLARAAGFRAALDSARAELQALHGPAQRRFAALGRVRLQLVGAQAEYLRLQHDLAASPLVAGVQSGELSSDLGRSRESLSEVLTALQRLQERAAENGLAASAAGMAERAAALQRSLADLQETMRERGGTLDRLARDSALVRALAATRAELDSLLADVKRRPLRFVF